MLNLPIDFLNFLLCSVYFFFFDLFGVLKFLLVYGLFDEQLIFVFPFTLIDFVLVRKIVGMTYLVTLL